MFRRAGWIRRLLPHADLTCYIVVLIVMLLLLLLITVCRSSDITACLCNLAGLGLQQVNAMSVWFSSWLKKGSHD